MMPRKILFIAILFIVGNGVAIAQKKDATRSEVQEDLENALESFDPSNPNLNTEQLTLILEDLASHPLNINEVKAEDLLLIPGINLRQARAVIAYRKNIKPFENINELQKVKGIGNATFDHLKPYVTVGSGLELSRALYSSSRYWTSDGHVVVYSRYQQTLQKQEGYVRADSNGGYLGSPAKYYQRFRYNSDHLSVNLTQQKDAGEPWAGKTGFDYNSGHLALENNGKLREMVIGDYALYFGQGMVLWNGRTFGKGREVINTVNRNSRGIRPYSSSQESNAYRGIAATYGGKLQVSGFYSARKQSASKISVDTMRMPQKDGYHRTENERAHLNDLNQTVYGGHVRMEFPFGFIGATGYETTFDKVVSGGNGLADRFDFRGKRNAVVGIDYTILAGPAIIYGEGGRSRNGGLGFLSGVESGIGPNTDLTIAYRNYARNFQSLLGNGFGERSGAPKNEEGIYFGVRHSLTDNITLSTYIDQYRFPAPVFGTSQPSRGHDWLGLLEVDLNHDLQFYVQARSEIKGQEYEIDDRYGREQTRLGNALRGSIRAQFAYQVNPKIRLRTRGEAIRSRKAGEMEEYGYLLYQDLRFTPDPEWTFDTRITIFDTDSYHTRLYQFENDLLYVLSNQVLYNQGQRMYLVANYEPFTCMEIWAKVGITIFENEQTISSGLNEIQGNKRSDVGLEVRFKF